MASRTLYVGQTVTIQTADGSKFYLPVTSASCEVSRPIEFVTTFGHINNVAAAQNNFTTCKSSIKSYLINGSTTGTAGGTGLSLTLIQKLTGDAVTGAKDVITVSPGGFVMSGIISNLGLDAAFGSFATVDMSFNGLGEPYFDGPPSSSAVPSDSATMPSSITPVVSQFISGITGCASSIKLSFDLPNEPLACLGDSVTGRQEQITNSLLVMKFPLKASLTLEGYGLNISLTGDTSGAGAGFQDGVAVMAGSQYNLGGIRFQLPNPKVTAKSMNQAVGNVGATYNLTAEDVFVNFA